MIPIYRAKKIDSDEYIDGYYIYSEYENKHFIVQDLVKSINHACTGGYSLAHWFEADPTTLAIHFPNMLDCQGNKIFASLSKDGKGGDMTNKGICLYEPKYNQFRIIVNLETRTWLEITREDLESYPIKVIGIQE